MNRPTDRKARGSHPSGGQELLHADYFNSENQGKEALGEKKVKILAEGKILEVEKDPQK